MASHFGLGGIKASVLSACSSSTVAIGYAGEAITRGQADAMIAGASDALCRLTLTGFNALRLVDGEPCRPFCRTRKGMNIGEAAAMLVLEEMSHAKRRGARIYAELAGYGMRCEAYHPTAPEPEGKAVAALIADALRAARLSADDIDHINAHGTATPQNDQAEARGLHRVFGERARQTPRHVHQVDGRTLSGRRGRDRGRGARAVDRVRRRAADHQLPRVAIRNAISRSWPTTRGRLRLPARCPRLSPSAATTPRW